MKINLVLLGRTSERSSRLDDVTVNRLGLEWRVIAPGYSIPTNWSASF